MTDTRALAYVNLYGILATLENLCAMDRKAQDILKKIKTPVSLCFDVKDGPCGTLNFDQDGCIFTEGSEGCTCKMYFASPKAFNDLIDKSKPGIPTKNPVQVLSFLLGPFTALTNRLTELLRPTKEALQDRAFFELSTTLTFYTIVGGISTAILVITAIMILPVIITPLSTFGMRIFEEISIFGFCMAV